MWSSSPACLVGLDVSEADVPGVLGRLAKGRKLGAAGKQLLTDLLPSLPLPSPWARRPLKGALSSEVTFYNSRQKLFFLNPVSRCALSSY